MTQEKLHFYRPGWTCGRYNAEKQVALIYNLLEGTSYLLADDSAAVIGEILSVQRNGTVSVVNVSKKTDIDKDSIIEFFEKLVTLRLLNRSVPTGKEILLYRKTVADKRKTTLKNSKQSEETEKSIFGKDTAEKMYFKAVSGISQATFELTYNCSEKCIQCYNPGATRNDMEKSFRGNREELIFTDYQRIIDELCEQGLVNVCLTGGDPFSNPFAWDIIDYLYKKEIAITIFTNAQKLTDKIDKLASYYPQLIGISIYSGVSEVHDKITRVKSSCERSKKAATELAKLGVLLQLKCPVMQPNLKTLHTVADFAKQIGAFAQFDVNVVNAVDGDYCASQYLRLTPEMMEIMFRSEYLPLHISSENLDRCTMKHDENSNACAAGKYAVVITPEGNVQPCVAFPLIFGNVKTQSIAEILDGNIRKQWIARTLKEYEECGKHDFCDYCHICPAHAQVEHGNPLKAATLDCGTAKVRQQLAQKLSRGIDPLHGKSIQECLEQFDIQQDMALKRVV
jgi:radical SAM protein with 4Fe4S-binding SPASM domain